MKCQVNKKDNSRCDKESVMEFDKVYMCTQHYKTFVKNKVHQYGTCKDKKIDILNLTIKEYLFASKIKVKDLND